VSVTFASRLPSGSRARDLLVILDDASGEVYYAQLVEQESTETVLAGLREVVEQRGIFCSLYSDRASHFWLTPKAGEPVDRQRLTQVGRALRELGIAMIPAYSPQARAQRAEFWDLAAAVAAGVAAARDHHAGRGQSLPAGKLRRGVQSPICGRGINVVLNDILALTKLNYNTCIFGDGMPVTLKFADAVGEILTAGPIKDVPPLPFSHYI
jgi:hypothetical protein